MVRTSLIALATVLAAGTAALAAPLDGDNNPVPGVQRQAGFLGAFASARMPVTAAPRRAGTRMMVIRIEIDGDGNPVVFEQR